MNHKRPLFAPVVTTIAALALAALPTAWTMGGMSIVTMPFDLSAPISAGLIGIFSAWLWLQAAWDTTDQLSNAAAAGFSGATAAFGVGGISFSPAISSSQPWLTAHWPTGSYVFGWVIVMAVVITVWWRRARP